MGNYGDAYNSAIAAELRAERARRKITVEDLGKASGLSKSATINYLNDKRDIPTTALGDLCLALGISPRVIADRAENALDQN